MSLQVGSPCLGPAQSASPCIIASRTCLQRERETSPARSSAGSEQSIAARLLRLRDPHTGQPLSGKQAVLSLRMCLPAGQPGRRGSLRLLPRLFILYSLSPTLRQPCSGQAGARDCNLFCGRHGYYSTHDGGLAGWEVLTV